MTMLLGVAAVCLVTALILIVVELLVPSFGTVGMVAAGVLIAGAVAAFAAGLMWGAIYVALAVAGIPLAVRAGIRALPNTPIGRRVILAGPVTPGHAGAVPAEKLRRLEHASGTTVTDLRPVGTAIVGGERIDVEAEADWIDANTAVQVVRIDGMRIVVRPTAGTANPVTEESSHA
jgi:membrane-bound serine protease (ClpP class)